MRKLAAMIVAFSFLSSGVSFADERTDALVDFYTCDAKCERMLSEAKEDERTEALLSFYVCDEKCEKALAAAKMDSQTEGLLMFHVDTR